MITYIDREKQLIPKLMSIRNWETVKILEVDGEMPLRIVQALQIPKHYVVGLATIWTFVS